MNKDILDNVPRQSNKSHDIGKDIGQAGVNAALGTNKEGKNMSEELENQAKTAARSAIAAGKAVAKASAGDVVGAAKDVVKDEGLRKLILGVIAVVVALPIMMYSLVPNVLFAPTEAAYNNNHDRVTLIDIIQGLFHIMEESESDSYLDGLIANKMMDGNSLKVIASDNEVIPDFDIAPNNANATMQNMIKVTQDRYEKRHEALLQYIEADFNERKRTLGSNVIKVINDPLANGSTTTAKEAVKLMCLYSVMNDDVVEGVSFDDFREWLGDEASGFFFKIDDEGYDDWYVKPQKWKGSMLPQELYDQRRRDIMGTEPFTEDTYIDSYTSALSEILKINPEVSVSTETVSDETEESGDEESTDGTASTDEDVKEDETDTSSDETAGGESEETHSETETEGTEDESDEAGDGEGDGSSGSCTIVTYSIDVKSVDDICNDVVRFDEAVTLDADGQPLKLDAATHREEYYKELCGSGEGQGVALKYFGVQSGGLYTGGIGIGSDIVKVAQEEIGTVEEPENYVKYNDWYYGSHRGGADVPWCAAFVSWCANECGYIDSGIVPKSASCRIFKMFYGEKGATASVTDTSFIPKPGDFIIRGGASSHIGIIEKYEDGTLYTIEGNSGPGISDVDNNGGCVARHAYGEDQTVSIIDAWGNDGVYCRPEYPVSAADGVGAVCFAFETGGQILGQANPWYCEDIHDGAGMNYGMMSTNRGQALSLYNYIISNSENFRNQIGSMSMFSSAFNNWWRGSHSDMDTSEMSALQSAWAWQAYGEPACEGEFSYLKRSRTLQEMALSRSVHRGSGGARSMFRCACITETMTDAQIINAVYDYEIANITARNPSYTEALRRRMSLEKSMILDNFI